MSFLSLRRRFLIINISFQFVSLILLLVCCILPNWWVITYKRSVVPTREISINLGLWKTCKDELGSETCENYDGDNANNADRINNLLLLRICTILPSVLTVICLMISCVLLFRQTFRVLISISVAVKILSWGICVMFGLCIGYTLTDQSEPKPPLWSIGSISKLNYIQTEMKYGWIFILLCIAGGISIMNLILVTLTLSVIILHQRKYYILPARSVSASSSKKSDQDQQSDLNANYYMKPKDKKSGKGDKKSGKQDRKEGNNKDKPLRHFMYYHNNGFLPDIQRTPTPSSYRSDSPNRIDGLTAVFEQQISYQSSKFSDSSYTQTQHQENTDGVHETYTGLNAGVHYGDYESPNICFYGNTNDNLVQSTILTAVKKEQDKRDQSQQTTPAVDHRTFLTPSNPPPPSEVTIHQASVQNPHYISAPTEKIEPKSKIFIIPVERSIPIERPKSLSIHQHTTRQVVDVNPHQSTEIIRNGLNTHPPIRAVSLGQVRVNTKQNEPKVFNVAGKNHGYPPPDYE